jgi:hypothetical protein
MYTFVHHVSTSWGSHSVVSFVLCAEVTSGYNYAEDRETRVIAGPIDAAGFIFLCLRKYDIVPVHDVPRQMLNT